MNPSLTRKLEGLHDRFQEIGILLADPDTLADIDRLKALAQEHAELSKVAECFERYNHIIGSIDEAQGVLDGPDKELHPLAHEEIESATLQRDRLEHEIKLLLIPTDPADDGNAWLEIRAGTGGDEAALFAGDLFRMYLRYAASRHWQTEIAGESPGELGGYKEIVARITGPKVYSRLKFESGVHRVQRVPETESQGRIHTSACTVAILPEADAIETVKIDSADLRVDTFRASGAGGQHVNKTDSAIRITHLPTGTVVECQDERSQHKNRARAMSLLGSKLLDAQRRKQDAERARTRRLLIGSGDRSQRIRTYNFPQKRVSDHRINLSLYKIHEIMAGDLDEIVDALINEDRADQLATLAN